MTKLSGFIAGAVLMAGMGAANAGETPEVLGAADYQAMSQSELSNITGQASARANLATSTKIKADVDAQGTPALPAQPNLPAGVVQIVLN